MGSVIRLPLPREATAAKVTPTRPDIYDKAYRAALDAGADWPAMLGYAQTLSHSPHPAHTSLARHIRDAYSLHMAKVVQADPIHRAKSDMVDRWRAEAAEREAQETSVQIAMRYRTELLALVAGVVAAVVIAAGFGWWVL